MSFLFHPSGGLTYHIKSIQHINKEWKTFYTILQSHLDQWKPKSSHLVIVGASGGYFMSKSFLKRFDKITCIDPDKIAKWIFSLRYSDINTTWDHSDFLSRKKFIKLISKYSDACFLFSNTLGQLPFILPLDVNINNWYKDFNQAFKNTEFFSFHERLSCEQSLKDIQVSSPLSLSNSDLIKLFLDSETITVYDHLTGSLFPTSQKHYAVWNLTKSDFHLMEIHKQSKIS